MSSQTTISEECEAYEKFARANFTDGAFPMVKNKLLRYIKFRARSSTFTNFMTNLEKHPLHGITWLNRMNNDPDVQKLMQFSLNLWPRQSKLCTSPLVGIGTVTENGIFEDDWAKLRKQRELEEAKCKEQVRVFDRKKGKGFMVTDNTSLPSSQVDPGSSSSAPIELDDRKPTPLFNFTFKPTSLANRDSKPSTISLQKKKAPEAAHPKSSLKVETSKKKSKTTKPSSSLPKAKSALKAPTKSEPDKLLSKSVMRPKSAIKAVMKLKSTKSATKPKSTLKHRPTQSTESSKQDLSVTKKVIIRIESLDPDATKPTIKRQPVKDTKSKDKASSKRNPVSREKEKIVMPEPIAFIKRDSDTLDKKKQKRVKFNINDEKEVVLNTTGSKRGLERKKKKRYSAPEVVKRMFELFPQLKRPVGRPPSTFKIPHPVVLIKKQKPESAQLAQSTQKRKPEVISFVDDEDDDEDDYYTAKKQKLDTNSLQNVRVVIRKCQ